MGGGINIQIRSLSILADFKHGFRFWYISPMAPFCESMQVHDSFHRQNMKEMTLCDFKAICKKPGGFLPFFFFSPNGWNTHSWHPEPPCEKPDYLEAILLWGGLSHRKEQWTEALVPSPSWALPWSPASADRVEKLPGDSNLQLFTSSQLRLQMS